MGLLREAMTLRSLDTAASVTVSPLDAELVIMQLITLGVGRYIARLPQLSEGSIDRIVERVGPNLDRYLRTSSG